MEIRNSNQIPDEVKKRIKSMAEEAIKKVEKAHELIEKSRFLESIDFSSEAVFWASRAVVNSFGEDSDSMIDLTKIMLSMVEKETIEPFFYNTIIGAVGISSSTLDSSNDALFKEEAQEIYNRSIELVKILKDIIF